MMPGPVRLVQGVMSFQSFEVLDDKAKLYSLLDQDKYLRLLSGKQIISITGPVKRKIAQTNCQGTSFLTWRLDKNKHPLL